MEQRVSSRAHRKTAPARRRQSARMTHNLALVLITRDEARCLERCLRSAAGAVDEMWVLDTGSVDDTAAIARRCGAGVVHWRWRDDFAAARNAALALTRCDWRLVLDADEWIGGSAYALQDWQRDATPRLGLLRVSSLVEDAAAGVQYAPSWLPRLLPRGVPYAGKVHEQPVSTLPRQRLDLLVLHDGYLPSQMARKGDRNRRMLQQALHAAPHDAYLSYQLGKDHEVHGRFDQAEPCYAHALDVAEAAASWRHDLVLRQLFTLKKLARFDDALLLAGREMRHWSDSPDFHFTLGDVLLDWAAAQPQHAAALLPMIESSWRRALEIGENPALPDTVAGRGSHLAAHNLAVFHQSLGDAAQARHWREQAARMRAEARLSASLPDAAIG